MESACAGILAGINAANRILGKEKFVPNELTISGALARYISDENVKNFQPMGASFGLLPPLETKIRDKKQRYEALAERGLEALKNQLAE
jgi:methylenetetrahydrofolate--tRNA-(uracil-5-)-methyltransferase